MNRNIFRNILALLFAFAALGATAADSWTQDGLFDSPELRDSLALKPEGRHRPIFYDQVDIYTTYGKEHREMIQGGYLDFHYLDNRKALVGEHCSINKMINSVGVGSWNENLGNLLNGDLDDYCAFDAVASIGVTTDPLVSIRDRSCFYAKGTTAGFCLVSGTDNSVLSLDLVKAMAIGFYREGNLVGVVGGADGQSAGLLNLSLIQIPGSEEACVNVTAVAPGVFDEITLDFSGGVSVSAGQTIRIRYAFVGRPQEFTVTRFDYHENQFGILPNTVNDQRGHTPVFHDLYPENEDVELNYVKGWNPVLLGLPIPISSSAMENLIDEPALDDADDNFILLTPLLAIGYQGGAKFMLRHRDDRAKEVFQPGTEVGFKYKCAELAQLAAGGWINFRLYDADGNMVQEENISAQVLSLGVAAGEAQNSTVIARVPFSGAEIRFHTVLSLDLGGIMVYHAFVRNKPAVNHHCPINPSVSTLLCASQDRLQLRSNPEVSVSWSIVQKPEGSPVQVSESGLVTGLDPEAEAAAGDWHYVFRATAADGLCYDEVEIIHAQSDDAANYNNLCGVPITNNDADPDAPKYAVITESDYPAITGGLIHIDDLKNAQAVTTPDINDYATYVGGLEVATNTPVIGVRRIDEALDEEGKPQPGLIYDASKTTRKRLGFVVASDIEGLNVNALQFWQIGCYYKGNQVCRTVIDESNVVSADIGGSNRLQKMRFSIAVPEEMELKKGEIEPTKVDAIILWSSGVLALEGSRIDIFYPFIEEADAGCNDPMGCNPTIISADATHATLDFDLMQSGSAIVAANAVNDIDNLIDDDLDSFMTIANSVSLGDGVPVAVKIGRTVDYRHQLGIVMDNKTFLLGVNLGSWMTVETYYRGEPTGDKFSDWNAIDANVIGYGDRNVVIVQPKYIYDEVKLTIAKIGGVLDIMKFYGLFLRGDIDNDGVPDCQDIDSCPQKLTVTADKVCVGDEIEFETEGQEGTTYWVRFSEPDIADGKGLQMVQADDEGIIRASYPTRTPGQYQVVYYENRRVETDKRDQNGDLLTDDEGNVLKEDIPGKTLASETYCVYPKSTSWKRDASSPDWDKWDNWSEGIPYCCTDVVIPSGAAYYPDLAGVIEQGDEYCCDRIHFEPEAEIGHATRLNYNKAWVALSLAPNRYHLLSAPLHVMYTGDMFIPADMRGNHSAPLFSPIDATTAPENRFDPTVYQRMWSSTVKEYGLGASKVFDMEVDLSDQTGLDGLTTSLWSKNFNHVASLYRPGAGFSMWVDNGVLDETQEFRFLFPKEHEDYTYFLDYGDREDVGERELTPRSVSSETGDTRDLSGRFIYEGLNAASPHKPFSYSRTDGEATEQRVVYSGTLPWTLTLENEHTSDHFLFGNPFMSPIDVATFLSENSDRIGSVMFYDGNTVRSVALDAATGATVGETEFQSIPPMTSVFVKSRQSAKSLDILLTDRMLALRETKVEQERTPALRLSLSDGESETAMSVLLGEERTHNEILFDNEVAPRLALFTVSDGQARDITVASDILPLTLLNRSGKGLTLDFHAGGGFPREDYALCDLQTGEVWPLDEKVTLPVIPAFSSGRFVLKRNGESGLRETAWPKAGDEIYLEGDGGSLEVVSLSSPLSEIRVFDIEGRLLGAKGCASDRERTDSFGEGVRLVRATTVSGATRVFRILVRR